MVSFICREGDVTTWENKGNKKLNIMFGNVFQN